MKFIDVVKHDGEKIVEIDNNKLIDWIKETSPRLYAMILDELTLWSEATNQGDNITKELKREAYNQIELSLKKFSERRKKSRFLDYGES